MEGEEINMKTFGGSSTDSDLLVQNNPYNPDRSYSTIKYQHPATPATHNGFSGRMNPFHSSRSSKYIDQPYDERELIRVYEKPRDWTMRALLSLLCFCPTGIVALIKSIQAKSAVSTGDLKEAHRKSTAARDWTRATLCIGILFYTVITLTCILVKLLDSH